MNYKNILALFGVVLFGAGLVMAISGATVGTEVERGRWTGLTAGSVGTEGGNISGVNVTGSTLTDRWASFYGNVTGNITLSDSAANDVFTWTWTPADGGEVCLSEDSAFAFASAVASTGAAIDTDMGWGASSDDGVTTYTGGAGAITFNGVAAITTADSVTLQGSSNFVDVVVSDGADLAYCTNINTAGSNYNGETANYEVMVPTALSGTTTYYFFAEMN